jgi:hypothetical protein
VSAVGRSSVVCEATKAGEFRNSACRNRKGPTAIRPRVETHGDHERDRALLPCRVPRAEGAADRGVEGEPHEQGLYHPVGRTRDRCSQDDDERRRRDAGRDEREPDRDRLRDLQRDPGGRERHHRDRDRPRRTGQDARDRPTDHERPEHDQTRFDRADVVGETEREGKQDAERLEGQRHDGGEQRDPHGRILRGSSYRAGGCSLGRAVSVSSDSTSGITSR